MKQVKQGLVPKLRFREFVGDGNLENKKIGNLCKITTGKLDANAMVENGQYRFYTCAKDYYFINKYAFDTEALLISGNGANVGYIHYYKGKFNAYQRTYVLDQFTQDIFFIKYYLERNLSKRIATEKKDGNTPYIVLSSISEMSVMLPKDKKEQQKIADCLSSLDELIDAEDKKLESLRLHKKVLMQELFPAEGQTLPKLHFPEFGNSPEWKTKKLGQIGDILMCKRIFAQETNDKGGIPFYKIGTLGGKPDAFIAKELFEEYKSKYNYPKKDEVLITCSGTVGKCLAFDGNDSYYQDSNIVWIDNKSLEISNKFLLILLSNTDWTKLNSTTITRIYGSDLRELSFVFPADEKEQQHIADFLSSIDNLITTQTKKLDSLRLHKKGLMQQLFPNPDN